MLEGSDNEDWAESQATQRASLKAWQMAQTTNRKKAHCTAPTKGLLQGDEEGLAETQATPMTTSKAWEMDETTDRKKARCSN